MRALRRSAPFLALLAALLLSACGLSDSEPTRATTSSSHSSQGEDDSLGSFGHEAEGEDKEAILAGEQGYLAALGERDFQAACSHLAKQTADSLLQFAPPELRAEGCAAVLSKVLAPAAISDAAEQAEGEITAVRLEGDQAFVTYRAPGARLYAFSLVRDEGEWGVTTVTGSVIVPARTS
jgi:hypothetical protein